MQKMKRLVAVLLAGILSLTLLTGCSFSWNMVERSSKLEGAAAYVLAKDSAVPFENAQIDAAVVKYAFKLLSNPEDQTLSGAFSEDILKILEGKNAWGGLLTFDGALTEDAAINELKETATDPNGNIPNNNRYYVRAYHIENPFQRGDGVWALFYVSYSE